MTGPIPNDAKVVTYTKFEDSDNPGFSEGYYCTVKFEEGKPYAELPEIYVDGFYRESWING